MQVMNVTDLDSKSFAAKWRLPALEKAALGCPLPLQAAVVQSPAIIA